MAGRQSAGAWRDGLYLLGPEQRCRSIIISLKGEMVVEEHLDAGPHVEDSRCGG